MRSVVLAEAMWKVLCRQPATEGQLRKSCGKLVCRLVGSQNIRPRLREFTLEAGQVNDLLMKPIRTHSARKNEYASVSRNQKLHLFRFRNVWPDSQ